jgi:2-methylisocitrate lyase-like PEP mutase family enzyme
MSERSVTDALGRKLAVKRLSALERLRVYKAAGADLAMNRMWMGSAFVAASVTAIDGTPCPVAVNEAMLEAQVGRLGDEGIAAANVAMAALEAEAAAERESAVKVLAGN